MQQWLQANPQPYASISDVADHIDHVRKVAGIDHIGLGSDFDGIDRGPRGLESVADFPRLFAELLRRGYSESDLKKIAGQNLLRVLRAAEATAQRLQAVSTN
jgi:membrane dipeptidase